MSGHIVYNGVSRTANDDDDNRPRASLFAGQKLWFAHRMPLRDDMMKNARCNGAVIVDRDTDADVRLVDHLRKNNAPGTYSYRYVELSLRKGQLENLADHAVGAPSRVSRPVGSTVTAPRAARIPFTPEDDQFLWDWMKPFVDRGGAWKGNEIYKQIEEANPRHTFQSWRDRWIKHTRFQERKVSQTVAPRTPRGDEPAMPQSHSSPEKKRRREVHDDGEKERARPEGGMSQLTTATEGRGADRLPEVATTDEEARLTMPTSPERPKHADGSQSDSKQAQSSTNALPELPKSFTKDEYDELYQMVATYAGQEFDDFYTPWRMVAQERGTHTAAEWQRFYISRVVPDYCRNTGLTLSQAAPYLSEKSEKHAVPTFEPVAEHDQATSASSETEHYRCTNCFTDKTVKWRHDQEGKLICYECAQFVRRHGHHRPSTRWSIGENVVNTDGPNARPPPSTEDQNNSGTQTVIPQDTSFVSSGKQNHSLAGEGSANLPTPPLFQPDPSTTSRPPGPNESRKRRVGQSTQSQSTQESNRSATQSQTVDCSLPGESQSQTVQSQSLAAETGEAQLKESDSQITRSTLTEAGVSLKATPPIAKGMQLQDGLGDASARKHASIDTENGAHRPSRTFSIAESDLDNQVSHFTASYNPPKRVRTHRNDSPLFFPEHDNNDEEAELSRSVSSFRHQASEQFETAQESVQEYGTGPEEQSQVQTELTCENAMSLGEIGQSDDSQDYPEVPIKLESHRFLGSPPMLLPSSPGSGDVPRPSENAKGKQKQVEEQRSEQGRARESSSPEPDGHETDEWIALQRSLHPHVRNLEPVLFKAIESTSFDFRRASEVVDIMLANRRHLITEQRRPNWANGVGRSASFAEADLEMESLLPQAMRGVWTETDDSLLLSPNASDVDKVLRKHGRDGCDARFVFLAEFVEG
ncbi:hypothetical protein AYL99_01165 [Fonsecaea erecta]|uniref:DNA-binding protein RAP1 n=1 Tax=Fonsecaea erecta TaxID=1367422 RepID=A0A179A185_9EURO|nr:hypothetical protein AYL99_01165 [Fonsecaea erecta]OAP65193.1 hypothetical protein AYL99_01165 [Fonsecaea erecta]